MMNKYIDADKLIAEIERFRASEYGGNTLEDDVANGALDYVLEEIIPSLQQEQPEYGYLSTEYIHGKKPRWNVGDVLAYYMCTSNEEGEYVIGKVSNVEFDDEEGWLYTFENEDVYDEQFLVEEGVYKKNC